MPEIQRAHNRRNREETRLKRTIQRGRKCLNVHGKRKEKSTSSGINSISEFN